jgi:hypothetical protein
VLAHGHRHRTKQIGDFPDQRGFLHALLGTSGEKKLFLVNADAGGREIKQNQRRGDEPEVRRRFGLPTTEVVTVLNQFAAGRQERADFFREHVGGVGLKIKQWQAGENCANTLNVAGVVLEEFVQLKGITRDDVGAGITGA